MTVLKVDGMHCGKCVARIEKAMKEDEIAVTVSLEDKTVTVDGCEHCVKKAIEVLDDLGFDAVVEA